MEILTTPHPFLHHVAKPLTSWDKKTAKQAAEMVTILKTRKNPQGVGLAATQVGLDKRFFLAIINKKVKVFVNPRVVKASKKMLSAVYPTKSERWLEGCLSIPKLWGFVDRPYEVTIEYQLPETMSIVTQTFTDTESSYIQHEIDHLDGILFTDRILTQNGTIFKETETGLSPLRI